MKGDIYHILNRGVEKRKIFLDEKDYLRFVHNLYDFNNKNEIFISYHRRQSAMRKPTGGERSMKRDNLVDILCWCLMPNHYHILVREKINGGASAFSKKISSGHTQYFNLKNERSGVLFQGRSKIIPVKQDNYFLYLPFYIFANPIKLIEKDWQEKSIKNLKQVINFLENYQWSSYLNVIGKDNFSFVVNQNKFSKSFIGDKKQFKKDFIEWLVGYAKADKNIYAKREV
ncbi:MAG: hypothetical protein U9P63_02325 [Patescibacteria group bacterium]|nr:hypothetical protein [Patescibacteria group bacterium]MEA2113469.1 hypothetical protein [Patescibacteria group bacterium]